MNFYSFHIGDYAAHTRRLSLMEDLAYRRLLDEYYLQESPLLGEPHDIARLIGMPDHVEAVAYVLGAYFDGGPGAWINKRCDQEIFRYQAKANAARRANAIRWSANSDQRSDVNSDLESDAPQIPTNNHEPITNTNITSLRSVSPIDTSKNDLKADDQPKAKRSRQIPADFQPNDQHRQLAQELGIDIGREFEKFSDHHRARGSVFKDWDAALRTWLRKSIDFGTKPAPARAPIDPAVVERAKTNFKVFVEIDTPEWFAWKETRKTLPVCDHKAEDGKLRRGWWFPSARP